MEGLWQRTGKKPAELNSPPTPKLWRSWVQYGELASRRPRGQPISWTEISAWATLTGRRLSPADLSGFSVIDGAYFRVLKENER